jgi:hypothetical protein
MHAALAKWRERRAEHGLAAALHSLGDLELEAGRLADASAAYAEGLRVAREIDAPRIVCYCLGGLAAVAAANGDRERAGALWRAVGALEQQIGFRLRRDVATRYAEFARPFAAEGKAFAEESLLEDAIAFALDEEPAPATPRASE